MSKRRVDLTKPENWHWAKPDDPLVLASASPRRAEILRSANIPFTVRVSPNPEPSRKPRVIPPHLWPMNLAYMKATAVQRELAMKHQRVGDLILAADTIVLPIKGPSKDQILNKPANRASAERMLKALSGRPHLVITGICLLRGKSLRLNNATAVCKVKRLSKKQLEIYLDSNLWKGKAGAYGLQDPFTDPFVTLINGDPTTVIGLPLQLLQTELASFPKD